VCRGYLPAMQALGLELVAIAGMTRQVQPCVPQRQENVDDLGSEELLEILLVELVSIAGMTRQVQPRIMPREENLDNPWFEELLEILLVELVSIAGMTRQVQPRIMPREENLDNPWFEELLEILLVELVSIAGMTRQVQWHVPQRQENRDDVSCEGWDGILLVDDAAWDSGGDARIAARGPRTDTFLDCPVTCDHYPLVVGSLCMQHRVKGDMGRAADDARGTWGSPTYGGSSIDASFEFKYSWIIQ
jgi:hypothetical protein